MKRAIFAFDVGSTQKSNFGWVRIDSDAQSDIVGSDNIEMLADWIERDLKNNYSVALGIEAPLFIPEPDSAQDLSKGRQNEGNRSFAAPSGGYVATLGLHQTAWLLRKLHQPCHKLCTFSLDWQVWSRISLSITSQPVFLCWEAFVSNTAHSDSNDKYLHINDAATAATAFLEHENSWSSAVTTDHPLSLIGAAALWSGWSTDLAILHKQTLVIKPERKYSGTSLKILPSI